MKSQFQKSPLLKDDEKFLQGINLVTGDKIDYAKHLLTETEVKAMCIDERLSKIQKFLHILAHGEKIQKWSIFENLSSYIENAEAAEKIIAEIETNYHEYEQFVAIIGEGLSGYLNKTKEQPTLLTGKSCESLYRLCIRTLTAPKYQGSDLLADWLETITKLLAQPQYLISNRKTKLNEMREYINGSFAMNALPQRRKTALEMIGALLELSQDIEKQAQQKILFFNSDLNPATRLAICKIMRKILIRTPNSQIWKCVQDYYSNDKSRAVRQASYEILATLYWPNNAQLVFNAFEAEDISEANIVSKFATNIFTTFEQELRREPSYQFKVISFLNRSIRKNFDEGLVQLSRFYQSLISCISQSVLVQELELKKFDLQSPAVVFQLILLHKNITHIQFRDQVKRQVLRGLRFHEFDVKLDRNTAQNLVEMLQLTCQEDVTCYHLLLGKQVDASRWKIVQILLERVQQLKLYQTQYQRIMISIVKIYQSCPYFLLDLVHAAILFLMLNDRKNLEMYQKIKEKFMGSRCWMHRRNYLKLYTFLKINSSYEFNKNFPIFPYKSMLTQKTVLIKQEFLLEFQKAYPFLDPTSQQEKNLIKEVAAKLGEDKDRQLASLAQITLEKIREVEKDYELIHSNILRNKKLFDQQAEVDQVQSETKKHIKTEKLISKDMRDVKMKKAMDNKTSLNLVKLGNLDRNKPGFVIESKVALKRSSSSQNKKQTTIKFGLPSYKKSRF